MTIQAICNLTTDEALLLCSIINRDGTAGPYAQPETLPYFRLSYVLGLCRALQGAGKLTDRGADVLDTLTTKLERDQ